MTGVQTCALPISTITEPAVLSISSEVSTDISCFGLTDGTITITASGGAGTLNYSIDSGSTYSNTTGLFTGLGAASYDIVIQDSLNPTCILNGSALTIVEPAVLNISSEIATDITCNGLSDGTITIVASGGTGALNYSIDGGSTYSNTTGAFTGLDSGSYDIVVQDSVNTSCTLVGSTLAIIDPDILTLTASSIDASCGSAEDRKSVV